ncbi:MAG: deoxyribonuclease V [Anaerolineae bacterium]|nr:deoxyribonuclease V [Anaerolineae bacterium]
MKLQILHNWNLSPQEAIALQRQLAAQVITDRPLDLNAIHFVGGVDVSVKDNHSQAAVVVLRYPELDVIETVRADQPTPFPYIPGLLSFREGPVLVKAFEQLVNIPDVFIFDGMGIMHPRRLGIASQMGLWLQRPTIGCGKTYFIGEYAEPSLEQGASSPLTHKGDLIGAVLRTRAQVKPVFISPGHLCDLDSAITLTLRCTTRYRLPEPIRQAHHAAGQFESP